MNTGHALDAATLAACRTAADHADDVDRASRIPEEALSALQTQALMGLLVPAALGGPGRGLAQVAAICHALAQSCGASAMIYAMHQIQLACIVAHGTGGDWHRALLSRICNDQLLLGSVTSEAGTGGNIHASLCAVEPAEQRVRLQKHATAVSYGARADALLLTARRHADAAAGDQVMVVALRGDCTLERTAGWDALGMRGTCTEGFRVQVSAAPQQIMPVPFADIAGQTMLPVSHLLWASVWLGIATAAVDRARAFLRRRARERGNPPMPAHRLARAVGLLQMMQARLSQALRDYDAVFPAGTRSLPLGFTADMNNLKITVSEQCLEAVRHAFMVCGIDAYRNGSEFSLGRHLRDLMSAPVMINNDRMLESTGNLLLLQRPALGVL